MTAPSLAPIHLTDRETPVAIQVERRSADGAYMHLPAC
jgi:hypothetical protein